MMEVELMADHPRSAPVCTTELPEALSLRWDPARSGLVDAMQQFEAALSSYQTLWRVLEDIDNHTWVLEPERPTLSSTIRRIGLGALLVSFTLCLSTTAPPVLITTSTQATIVLYNW